MTTKCNKSVSPHERHCISQSLPSTYCGYFRLYISSLCQIIAYLRLSATLSRLTNPHDQSTSPINSQYKVLGISSSWSRLLFCDWVLSEHKVSTQRTCLKLDSCRIRIQEKLAPGRHAIGWRVPWYLPATGVHHAHVLQKLSANWRSLCQTLDGSSENSDVPRHTQFCIQSECFSIW